jgi:membrane protease YdiL (CAAX protease family)
MNPPHSSNLPETLVVVFFLLAIVACVVVWKVIVMGWLQRQPVLPYRPRRPVPWRTFDVILLVSMYILMPAVVVRALYWCFNIPRGALLETAKNAPLNTEHPLSRVLLEGHNIGTILLCVASGVVIAPIVEELLFRLLLQGWLESLERRMRRRIPALRRVLAGLVPVVTVGFLFAAMHIRVSEPREELPAVVFRLSVFSLSSLLTVVAGVCWLRFAAGASLADLGIVPSKLAGDIRLGLVAFLAIIVPVYAVMVDVKILLPEIAVADPIPIFLLAIALGILYYRTHRIVPSLALHMAFNAVGVFVAITSAK